MYFYYNKLVVFNTKKKGMSSTNSHFLTPQSPIVHLDQEFDNLHHEMDLQSKQFEDQKSVFENNLKKQKKSNFNPISWTQEEEIRLTELHKKIGNKWTTLSKYFAGSCQNSIKNHFYSRLRKSIRKLNKNLTTLFGKRYAKFNLNIIFKLSNVSEGKVIGKCHVENQIQLFYKDFIYRLIEFSEQDEQTIDMDKMEMIGQIENFILALIALQNLFRLVSGERVYKGKKKNIAYLKRFNFKLDTESKRILVISKNNCYISDHPISEYSQSEKNSECLIQLNFDGLEQQNDSSIERTTVQDTKDQKTEKTIIFPEQCQKNYENETLSYATETQFSPSPQQFCLNDEMREYELTETVSKGQWYDSLLDQYSGNKFHFDIEC